MFLLNLNHEIPITKGPCNGKRTKGTDLLFQEQHSNYENINFYFKPPRPLSKTPF